jgi:formylglycine-generating enzyme required for sulfatase activity
MSEYKEWVPYLHDPLVLAAFVLLLFASAFFLLTRHKDSQLMNKGLNFLFILALLLVGLVFFKVQQSTPAMATTVSAPTVVTQPATLVPQPVIVAPVAPVRLSYEPEMVAIPNTHYAIGKYEVTVAQYLACVQDGGCGEPEWREAGSQYNIQTGSDEHYKKLGEALTGENYPTVGVSWNDAQQYVKWLSQKTNKSYRLPTESEWQTACLAGNQTEYCGGNDADAVAWYDGNSGNKTHPVGQKQPNAYGLYDMSGNVWEWMQDKYDNEHDWRVLRGGSWCYTPQNSRAAFRSGSTPAARHDDFGFRLARTLP